MSSPQPPQQLSPAQASAALLALEAATRTRISAATLALLAAINAALAPATRNAGDTTTGNQVIAHPEVYAAIVAAVDDARQQVRDTIDAALLAAALLALAATAHAFRDLGHAVPSVPPQPGTATRTNLLADVATAFGQAQLVIQRDVEAAIDGITGPGAGPARVIAGHQAVQRAVTALGNRVTASGVVAVHQGYTDVEAALWADYHAINPFVNVRAIWTVQSASPCPTCAALDGVEVGLNEEFPRGDVLPVWGTLLGPPRHPNCRCRLRYVL